MYGSGPARTGANSLMVLSRSAAMTLLIFSPAYCAVVPGTTIQTTCACRRATILYRAIVLMLSVSGCCVRPLSNSSSVARRMLKRWIGAHCAPRSGAAHNFCFSFVRSCHTTQQIGKLLFYGVPIMKSFARHGALNVVFVAWVYRYENSKQGSGVVVDYYLLVPHNCPIMRTC